MTFSLPGPRPGKPHPRNGETTEAPVHVSRRRELDHFLGTPAHDRPFRACRLRLRTSAGF